RKRALESRSCVGTRTALGINIIAPIGSQWHSTLADLERLATAVLDERSRRRGPPARQESHGKRPDETNSPSLPQGKVNAVRAAFQAGVTPKRIAREFGLSRSEVKSALDGFARTR